MASGHPQNFGKAPEPPSTARSPIRHGKKDCQSIAACGIPRLKLGLPKGSLQDATLEKLAKAGWNVTVSSRSYEPYVDDLSSRSA